MRSLFFLALLFGTSSSAIAQMDTLLLKIHRLNHWKTIMDTLSPFHEGNIEIIDSLNANAGNLLIDILNNRQIVALRADSMIRFFNAASDDRRVMSFSIFENTGGSFRTSMNYLFWLTEKNGPKAITLGYCNPSVEGQYYEGTIYRITKLMGNGKTRYLLEGGGISCNTCRFNNMILVSLEKDSVIMEQCLQIDYREDEGEMEYDPATRILSYFYMIYNEVPGAPCKEGKRIDANHCKVAGRYRFNGSEFEFLDGYELESEQE